jgi:hypothetical protein
MKVCTQHKVAGSECTGCGKRIWNSQADLDLATINSRDITEELEVGWPDKMTCSTCRWWVLDKNDSYNSLISPEDPVTYEQEKTEEAIATKWGHVVRRCRCPKITFYQRPERDGATVCDGSEYMAQLLTGPDFGCIHHEPND